MRLERGTLVSDTDPELARAIARVCHPGPVFAERVSEQTKIALDEAHAALERLAADGFLERIPTTWNGQPDIEWTTTTRGGALANASFLKPITRERARLLLDGVIARATDYNADPDKPMWVDQVSVFGSFLDPDAVDFGDLDVHAVFSHRSENPADAAREYAKRSGKRFQSFIDELFWPEKEARQILKGRNAYISLHTEDVTQFTDRVETVYERERADA